MATMMDVVDGEDEERFEAVMARVEAARPREPHARTLNSWRVNNRNILCAGIDVSGPNGTNDSYKNVQCKNKNCPACSDPNAELLSDRIKGRAWQTDPRFVSQKTVDYVCAGRLLCEQFLLGAMQANIRKAAMQAKKQNIGKAAKKATEKKYEAEYEADLKILERDHPACENGSSSTFCMTCSENGGRLPSMVQKKGTNLKCCVVRCYPFYRRHLAGDYHDPRRTQLNSIRETGLVMLKLAQIMEETFIHRGPREPVKKHSPHQIKQYIWAGEGLGDEKFGLLYLDGKKNSTTGNKKRLQHEAKRDSSASAVGEESSAQRAKCPLRRLYEADNIPECAPENTAYSVFREKGYHGMKKIDCAIGAWTVLRPTGTGAFQYYDESNVTNNPSQPYANRIAICHASDCLTTEGAWMRAALGIHVDLATPLMVVANREGLAHLAVDESVSARHQPELYRENWQRKMFDVRRNDLRYALTNACAESKDVINVLRKDGLEVPRLEEFASEDDPGYAHMKAKLQFLNNSGLCKVDVTSQKGIVFTPLPDGPEVHTTLFEALCEGDVHPSRANNLIVFVPPEAERGCMPNFGAGVDKKVFNLYAELRRFIDALRTFANLGVADDVPGSVADVLCRQDHLEGDQSRVPALEIKEGPQFVSPSVVEHDMIPAMKLLEWFEMDQFKHRWQGYKPMRRGMLSQSSSYSYEYEYVSDEDQLLGCKWPVNESGSPMSELDVAVNLYNARALTVACEDTLLANQLARDANVSTGATEVHGAELDKKLTYAKSELTKWWAYLVSIRKWRVVDYLISTPGFSSSVVDSVATVYATLTKGSADAVRNGQCIQSVRHPHHLRKAITTTLMGDATKYAEKYAMYITHMAARDEYAIRSSEYAEKCRSSSSPELADVYARLKGNADDKLGRSGGGQQRWRNLDRVGAAAIGSGLRERTVRLSVEARPIYGGGDCAGHRRSRKSKQTRVFQSHDDEGLATKLGREYKTAINQLNPTNPDRRNDDTNADFYAAFASSYENFIRSRRLLKFALPKNITGSSTLQLANLSTIRFIVTLCQDITRLLTGYTCPINMSPMLMGYPGVVEGRGSKPTFPAIATAFEDLNLAFEVYCVPEKELKDKLDGDSDRAKVERIAKIRTGVVISRGASDASHSTYSLWRCAENPTFEEMIKHLSMVRTTRLEQLNVEYAYHCLYEEERRQVVGGGWSDTFDALHRGEDVRSIVATLWCSKDRDEIQRRNVITDALRELFASGALSLNCLIGECKRLLQIRPLTPKDPKGTARSKPGGCGDLSIFEILDTFVTEATDWHNWRVNVVEAMDGLEEAVSMASVVMEHALGNAPTLGNGRYLPDKIYRNDKLTPSDAAGQWELCRASLTQRGCDNNIKNFQLKGVPGFENCETSAAFQLFASNANAIRDLISVLTLSATNDTFKRLLNDYDRLPDTIVKSPEFRNTLYNLSCESEPQTSNFVKLLDAEVRPFYFEKWSGENLVFELKHLCDDYDQEYGADLHDEHDNCVAILKEWCNEKVGPEQHDFRLDYSFVRDAHNKLVGLIAEEKDETGYMVFKRLQRVVTDLERDSEQRQWLSTQTRTSNCMIYGTLKNPTESYADVCKRLYNKHLLHKCGGDEALETPPTPPPPILEHINDWGSLDEVKRHFVENRQCDDCEFRVHNGIVGDERANLRHYDVSTASTAIFGVFDDEDGSIPTNLDCTGERTIPSEFMNPMEDNKCIRIIEAEAKVCKMYERRPTNCAELAAGGIQIDTGTKKRGRDAL